MKTTRLGNSGLEVSRLCLGCMSYGDPEWRPWILGEKEARAHLERALELGFNFFDTADMYSNGVSEKVTGKILKEIAHREDYVLATKCFHPVVQGPNRGGLSRKHILAACDDSLRRLGHDYIDLYQIHRLDHRTPMEEIVEALDSLVRQGKVRYLGASSMAAWEFATLLFLADASGSHRFVSMQDHYNLVYREEEREMIPLCLDQGIGVIPWSPLARGFLTGTRKREGKGDTPRAQADPFADDMYFRDGDWEIVEVLEKVSRDLDRKPAQVAIAWLLTVPGISAPIVGTTKIEQLEQLAEAVELELDEDTVARLEKPYRPHPILGHKQRGPRDF